MGEMSVTRVAAIGMTVMVVASLYANRKFRHVDRIPMQWSMDHEVDGTASRAVAFALVPVATIMTYIMLMIAHGGRLPLAPVIGIGIAFNLVHLVHIWLVGRTVGQPKAGQAAADRDRRSVRSP